jgi:hypothetical protein
MSFMSLVMLQTLKAKFLVYLEKTGKMSNLHFRVAFLAPRPKSGPRIVQIPAYLTVCLHFSCQICYVTKYTLLNTAGD